MNNEIPINISQKSDLDYLISNLDDGVLFANEFKFTERDYLVDLLEYLEIDYDDFTKTYYYYDKNKLLHISESGFGCVWISTNGLVPRGKPTKNKEVNACISQAAVLNIVLNKAIEISESENVYDIDSYNYGFLSELSPALFHNLIFYVEVFCKAYLSLCGIRLPRTHKLIDIYSKLIDTMYARNHNNSIFQVRIIDQLSNIIEHVSTMPGDFKEQFIKYDDNSEDTSVMIFHPERLKNTKTIIELSKDFILDFYYSGHKTYYLKSEFFQRVLDKAENEEERNRIKEMFDSLINNDNQK